MSCVSTKQLELFKYTSFDRKEVFESMMLFHPMNVQIPQNATGLPPPQGSSCCTVALDPWGQDLLLTDTGVSSLLRFVVFFYPQSKGCGQHAKGDAGKRPALREVSGRLGPRVPSARRSGRDSPPRGPEHRLLYFQTLLA